MDVDRFDELLAEAIRLEHEATAARSAARAKSAEASAAMRTARAAWAGDADDFWPRYDAAYEESQSHDDE